MSLIQGSVDFIRSCLAYEVTLGSLLSLAFVLILASMGLHWGLRASARAGYGLVSQNPQAIPDNSSSFKATTSASNQGSGGDQLDAGGPGQAAVNNQNTAGHQHAVRVCKPIFPPEIPPVPDPKDIYYDSAMREVSPLDARLRDVSYESYFSC